MGWALRCRPVGGESQECSGGSFCNACCVFMLAAAREDLLRRRMSPQFKASDFLVLSK